MRTVWLAFRVFNPWPYLLLNAALYALLTLIHARQGPSSDPAFTALAVLVLLMRNAFEGRLKRREVRELVALGMSWAALPGLKVSEKAVYGLGATLVYAAVLRGMPQAFWWPSVAWVAAWDAALALLVFLPSVTAGPGSVGG